VKFRFEFDIKKLPWPITHYHKLFMIGSCFTENIGEKLRRYKFSTLENAHGILFNPVSVTEAISDCIQCNVYETSDLFYLNEGWHSWKHHSRFSGLSPEEAVEKINTSISSAHIYLKQADYCFITLGSAWVYTLTEKAQNAEVGSIAANNHKAPAEWFRRRLLSVAEVENDLEGMINELKSFNEEIKIIFTISPVRHLREGVIDNNRSKAVLIQAVHALVNKREDLYYFPAYELVLDDLRDYRFFSEDLVHPNYFATQYVWEKFIGACTDEKTKNLMEEIERINSAFNHKPFNPTSEQHKSFMKNMHAAILKLEEQHPYLNFRKEKAYFSNGHSN
jgi:hypothetical protein